jgi:phosphoribosyl 1,2-cyclic phosphodiesterase
MIFCPLYSGSSGNSTFIGTNDTKILIDAGLSGKHIEKALCDINENPSNLDGIFVTHEHSDHIKGIGVISRRFDIPIYANANTWKSMSSSIGKIKEHNIKVIGGNIVELNDLTIKRFDIPHDAAAPSGYSVYCKNKKACVATDLGYFSKEVEEEIKEADVVLLESNHDEEMLKVGPYPYYLKRRILSDVGHLSNDACGKAIVEVIKNRRKNIILGHLSKTNNYPDLAYQTVINILNEEGVKLGEDVTITMAKRDMPSAYIEL